MKITDRLIGAGQPPFIIAEMSGNHNQSYERAVAIIEAAAKAGVDAMKFQTYTPETMTLDINDREFFINNPESLWHGQSLFDLYRQAYTPWEWHLPLFDLCRKLGVIPFSSAFDATAVDFLEELGVPCHKIASPENVDITLIRKMAATGKPLLISVGMANKNEIIEMLDAASQSGCSQIALLKCTTAYPARPEDANIMTIPYLRDQFGVEVGLSDHTPGIGVALAAVAHGASVIEKHFTLARQDGGVDAAFSMEPAEMRLLVDESKRAWNSLGCVYVGPTSAEATSLKGRRSLYVVEQMAAGELFTERNVRSIRPGHGLPPKHLTKVFGQKAARPIARGTALSWDLIEQ
jgi:pseudaminic acid synthase